MKSKNQRIRNRHIFFTGIAAASLLLGAGAAHAEPIDLTDFILNSSFEEFATQQLEDQANSTSFDQTDPIDWEPYFVNAIGGRRIGTLRADEPGTTWFSQAIPDGSERILLLFKDDPAQGGTGDYGVEQELMLTAEANRIYTLTVDVGNPTSDQGYNLQGMPNYRVELYAGNTLIAQNTEQADIPDGEYRTVRVSSDVTSGKEIVGQQLRIRLINEDNIDPDFPESSIEVDFDNVRLEALPIEFGPDVTRRLTPGKNGYIEIKFELAGEVAPTETKRFLMVGLGQSAGFPSMSSVDDPFFAIGDDDVGKLDWSDDWMLEDQVGEINTIVEAADIPTALTDSGIIIELGPGNYTARVASKGQYSKEGKKGDVYGLYAGFRVYDLDPDSGINVTYTVTPETKEKKSQKQIWFKKK